VTRCPFFVGKGKKTAWNTWNAFPEAIRAYLTMVEKQVMENTFDTLQQFILSMYDRSSALTNVNSVCQVLFARISKSLANIPPTEAFLKQHFLREEYTSGYVWAQNLDKDQHPPSPTSWGWEREGSKCRTSFWTTLQ
jgi:hypothetical protein